MDLLKHYDDLYLNFTAILLAEKYILDPMIDSVNDQRFGLTLLFQPGAEIKNEIQNFLDELKKIEPEQYYYPSTDIHVTVLSIISCYQGFKLDSISLLDYTRIIGECLSKIDPFEITFSGITGSPSAVMVQGFPSTAALNDLRNKLRDAFNNSGLEQTIDKRYVLLTAHSTVVRFKKRLTDPVGFLRILDRYRSRDFGKFRVNQLQLVLNDWYQRVRKVKVLQKFDLME